MGIILTGSLEIVGFDLTNSSGFSRFAFYIESAFYYKITGVFNYMSVDAQTETLGFQTEVQQLLELMIHSLYSNKEVFLRELISNASDALDKLRFEALSNDALYEGDSTLNIHISYDKTAHTITLRDNGIGMTRDEVVDNIGTIARSGTKQFIQALSGEQAKDSNLIGQFGVGFYSSFIVADKVTLITRRAGLSADQGVSWESEGKGSYELKTVEKADRGTTVILHLREADHDFLESYRLRSTVRKFSDHIAWPIMMASEALPVDESEDEAADGETAPKTAEPPKIEMINSASALWRKSKTDVTAEEYKEFYKHISHDFEEPLTYSHNHVEGTKEYISLLFIPKRAPFDLWDRNRQHGVKLYVRRVFIMDDTEHLMPQYLRFIRGVIDSDDLPLNVSREILQHNKLIDTIRTGSVKKILSTLESMAKDEPENYATFWKEFGKVLKEGPAEDFSNREKIAQLLRFASTHNTDSSQTVSLEDYIGRMKPNQEKIYFITADSYNAAKNSPHLEIFKEKGIEVLLLSDRVDEWLVSHLTEFAGKSLQSIAKGDLDLSKMGATDEAEAKAESDKTETPEPAEQHQSLLDRMTQALGDQVKQVRISHRLTTSPVCLVSDTYDMSGNLARMLEAAGQAVPKTKPILEINPKHPVVLHLNDEADEDRFADWAKLLLDQALLSEGGQLDDPAAFVQRMNQMLLSMMAQAKAA